MKLLVITGPLWPRIWNNANLIGKILPFLEEQHELQLLSPAFGAASEPLPEQVFGLPVTWVKDRRRGLRRHVLYPLLSRLSENGGYEGDLGASLMRDAAVRLYRDFSFEAVLFTVQPFNALLLSTKLHKVLRFCFLMDPLECLLDGKSGVLPKELAKQNCIFTTPFIKQALLDKGEVPLEPRICTVGFPHISRQQQVPHEQDISMDPNRINLLYTGALYPEIRSPKAFLELLRRLDERFCVIFMGRGCPEFWKRYKIETRAEVRTYPPLPYQAAVNAIARADVMINIGNNMHVHMPSKTLEYINSGKPIVNFHKFIDCPTLYYTTRYPLVLNLLESELDAERDLDAFVQFCLANKGKLVERSVIERIYQDCTPDYIAGQILDRLRPASLDREKR